MCTNNREKKKGKTREEDDFTEMATSIHTQNVVIEWLQSQSGLCRDRNSQDYSNSS